ncbi:MAG: rhomboid family intramembrane serine protease [Planctomycetota bacterium]
MGIYDREYYQEDQLRPLRPWDNNSMVTMLIIANVVVYLANFLVSSGDNSLTDAIALKPQSLYSPIYWWQFVTYGFAHDPRGIGHILFNMISLYFLGRSVEDRLGKWEFGRFYFVTIILCGIVWAIAHGGTPASLIGASGATTAVAMLFVFYFPQATLMVYGILPVKAWVLGIVIVGSNLFQPTSMEGNSVAYDVHLVGAAFAAVYCFGKLNFGSLGSVWTDWQAESKRRRSGLKVHRPSEPKVSGRDEKESDRILEKIHQQGESSLTAKERKFMQQYSKKLQGRRNDD